jgi:hypothetical protein
MGGGRGSHPPASRLRFEPKPTNQGSRPVDRSHFLGFFNPLLVVLTAPRRAVDFWWTCHGRLVGVTSAHVAYVAPLSMLTPVEFEARHQPTTAV